jgi:putative endonuclease
LRKRNYQHKNKANVKSFSAKYNLTKLVYFEVFHNIEEAIAREKQIKSGSRSKKNCFNRKMNPEWDDLGMQVDAW